MPTDIFDEISTDQAPDIFDEVSGGDIFDSISQKKPRPLTYKTPEEMNADIGNIMAAQEQGPVDISFTRPWSLDHVGADEPITAILPPGKDPRKEISEGRIKPGQVFYQSGVGKLRAGGPVVVKHSLDQYDPATGSAYQPPDYTIQDAIRDLAKDVKSGAQSLAGGAASALKSATPIPARLPDTVQEALGAVSKPVTAFGEDIAKRNEQMTKAEQPLTDQANYIRGYIADRLAMNTPEEIVSEAGRTGKVPYAPIFGRVLAEVLADSIPMTPTEVMKFYAVPKAVDAVAVELSQQFPSLQKSVGQAIDDWLLTRKTKVPISPEEIKSFFTFGRENLNPQTYEVLQKMNPEDVVRLVKARQGTAYEVRTPRFGAKPPEVVPPVPMAPPVQEPVPQPLTLSGPQPVMPTPPPMPDLSGLPIEKRILAGRGEPIPPPSDLISGVDVTPSQGYTLNREIPSIPPQSAPGAGPSLGGVGNPPQAIPPEPGSYPTSLTPPTPGAGSGSLPLSPTVGPSQGAVSYGEAEPKPGVKVPEKEVLAHAQALRRFDLENMALDPVEKAVLEAGGVRSNKDVRSEFGQDIPLYLRGPHDIDEVETDLRREGILKQNESLLTHLSKLKNKSNVPLVSDYMEQARLELQNDYEIYGPPKKTKPADIEPAPFEKGPVYSADAPIFYSQLQRTIEEKVPNSAPVDQVRNILKGGAVKQEEVDWSGIEDFLKGKEKVSKAELLDFLRQNEVKVQEKMLGRGISKQEQERLDYLRNASNERDLTKSEMKEYDALAIKEEQSVGKEDSTKFAGYQLPGGENYREVLLTLPDNKGSGNWATFDEKGRLIRRYGTEAEASAAAGEAGTFGRATDAKREGFRSSHFDEPNILAHVRMNDRTTADGKKMLFLEEVQSDWHQKGREKGYQKPAAITFKPSKGGVKAYLGDEYMGFWESESAARADLKSHPNYGNEIEGVPNAPFKKTWHELALKRMLRYAVDNGYDAIGWTTGEQQAERYDLSKQVEDVRVRKREDGTYNIAVTKKGESGLHIIDESAAEKDLPGIIGKDLATKVQSQEVGPVVKYSGVDLKVGGEGMKGFYDQMIPSFLNKYTKKWGGRVGESEITAQPSRALEDFRSQHLRMYPGATEEQVLSAYQRNQQKEKVHSLDITPAMRESVSQGQALFERQPGLFGGSEPITTKSPKQGEAGQMTLFGQKAQPKFEVPGTAFQKQVEPKTPEAVQPDLVPVTTKPGPQAQRLAKTGEGKEQVPLQVPRPLIESVVVKDLAEQGFLPTHTMRIDGPKDTAAIFNFLKNETVENFYALSLDAEDRMIGAQLVSVGVLDQTLVNPTDALRGAYLMGAKKVVFVHNHPSLRAEPSKEDVALTKVLSRASIEAGVELKHHVIVDGDTEYGLISPESGFSKGEVLPLEAGAPRGASGSIRLVKPLRHGSAVGTSIQNPQDVANYARSLGADIKSPQDVINYIQGVRQKPGGVLAIALDTRNQPASAWWMGEKYLPPDEMSASVGKIAMRNNVVRVILVGDRLPTYTYSETLGSRLKSTWGVDLLDVTALEGSEVRSAKGLGLLKDAESYGKASESGRLLIGNMADIKESFDHWFRVDKGVGPVVDRLNDERLGKIMVKAFDSSLNAKAVKAFIARNPSVPVKDALWDYLRKVGPLEAVPPEIRKNAEAMRADIDSLSPIVAKYGVPPNNEMLRAVIERNMGKYLGRYYRLFEQKRHSGGAYVPKPEDVKAFKEWARKERPRTLGKLSDEEMDGLIKNVLDKGMGTFSQGGKKINVPQGHFVKRKDVPAPVRKLYGEITDPVWLYLKTVEDQARIAFNGEFLSKISEIPGVFQNRAISENYKKLPEGKSWGPVSGKYVTKDMYDFLIDNFHPARSGWFMNFLQDYVVSPFKWTKTVGSLPSHPRNFMGNIAMAVLADVSPANPLNAKHYMDALDVLFNKTGKRAGTWRELLRNRVVGGQYWGTDVPKFLNELILDPQSYASRIADAAKWPIEKLGNLYNNEDLVYRIAAYQKYKSQGMSEKEAAFKVDRYFTNYDKLPRAVKGMRDWAVMGPFISYKANVIKIFKNAGEDAFRSAKAGNPLPAFRLAMVLSLPTIVAKVAKEVFKVKDEDAKKLQTYMPSFRKHGTLVYYRDGDGALKAFDLSFLWPTGDFERAARALLSGDAPAFADSLDLFSHPALEAWSTLISNTDTFTKGPISNDLDPLSKQLSDRVKRLVSSTYIPASLPIPDLGAAAQGKIQPGLLTGYQFKALIDAYNGVTDRYGRKREMSDELRGFLTGIRAWRVYPEVIMDQFIRREVVAAMTEKQEFRSWIKRNPGARKEAVDERVALYKARMKKIDADVEDAKQFMKYRVKRLEGK